MFLDDSIGGWATPYHPAGQSARSLFAYGYSVFTYLNNDSSYSYDATPSWAHLLVFGVRLTTVTMAIAAITNLTP